MENMNVLDPDYIEKQHKIQLEFEEKTKKYFKEELDDIEQEEKSDNPSLVDEILEEEYKKLIQLTIKSRAKLIEQCDYMFKKWKEHFCRELKSELRIERSRYIILDDNNYPKIPERLETYLNDTYDNEKRRIHCQLKYFDDDYDSLFVFIWSNYY